MLPTRRFQTRVQRCSSSSQWRIQTAWYCHRWHRWSLSVCLCWVPGLLCCRYINLVLGFLDSLIRLLSVLNAPPFQLQRERTSPALSPHSTSSRHPGFGVLWAVARSSCHRGWLTSSLWGSFPSGFCYPAPWWLFQLFSLSWTVSALQSLWNWGVE